MRPSTTKILWNDWVALFAAFMVPIIWVIHFAFPYVRRGASPPIELAVGISALALLLLGWRILRVRSLFASGRAAKGVITGLRLIRDRGRLDYTFTVQGATVAAWCPVHKTKQVLALRAGQDVEILYDPGNPRRAIVKELFAA